MTKIDIPLDYINECLSYDSQTGHLTWLERPLRHFLGDSRKQKIFNTTFAGKRAGRVSDRYRQISITYEGKLYTFQEHRLIWKMITQKDPECLLDHINSDRFDNRIVNLRECDHTLNNVNKKGAPSSSGLKGVVLVKSTGKYHTRIRYKGRRIFLGSYSTADEAYQSYLRASEHYYGNFSYHLSQQERQL